jgi:hypothetical protein
MALKWQKCAALQNAAADGMAALLLRQPRRMGVLDRHCLLGETSARQHLQIAAGADLAVEGGGDGVDQARSLAHHHGDLRQRPATRPALRRRPERTASYRRQQPRPRYTEGMTLFDTLGLTWDRASVPQEIPRASVERALFRYCRRQANETKHTFRRPPVRRS